MTHEATTKNITKMKKSNSMKALLSCLICALPFSDLHAAVVLTPPGLGNGEQYRLVFVTSTVRDGSSTIIADYNNFVTNAAAGNSLLDGITWSAIASTGSTSAISNTGTSPGGGGVPIYLLNGTRIADDYADLWDGGIASPLGIDENGNSLLDAFNVWTGSSSSGNVDAFGGLGSSFGPAAGSSNSTSGGWMNITSIGSSSELHLYAISEVLTVVPEPSSLALLGLGGLALLRRRRTRIAS